MFYVDIKMFFVLTGYKYVKSIKLMLRTIVHSFLYCVVSLHLSVYGIYSSKILSEQIYRLNWTIFFRHEIEYTVYRIPIFFHYVLVSIERLSSFTTDVLLKWYWRTVTYETTVSPVNLFRHWKLFVSGAAWLPCLNYVFIDLLYRVIFFKFIFIHR